MKNKWLFIFFILSVLFANSVLQAVSTMGIEMVRKKAVLDSSDFDVIDRFVAEAVGELVNSKEFVSVGGKRGVIISNSKSNRDSAQSQYHDRFTGSAYKYIGSGLKNASLLKPESLRFKVIMNLLILIDELNNARLAGLAIDMIGDKNPIVCYWAVRCVTSADIVKYLNSSDRQLAVRILRRLRGYVNQGSPEVLNMMAEFGKNVNVDIQQSEQLLVAIADKRLSEYADWKVDKELLDATLLIALCEKMKPGGVNGSVSGVRFVQLYSYSIQRYVIGKDLLGAEQKRQLASLLSEAERECISDILNMPQVDIRNAIARNNYSAIMQAHNKLFGGEGVAGELTSKYKLTFGKNPDGSERTSPLVLPGPPASGIKAGK
jgi:hypothetical protein